MHEVNRPDLVDGRRNRQRLRHGANQTLPGLDAQVELQGAIDAVDAFVIPPEPLHVAQVQEAQAEAPVPVRRRQPNQPVGNHRVFVRARCPIAVAGLADVEGQAGVPDARSPVRYHRPGHLPALRWPHHFFASASLSSSALSWESAYIFFSRRFSSSSFFRRAIIKASMSPYLLRHR